MTALPLPGGWAELASRAPDGVTDTTSVANERPQALPLVVELCDALRREGIAYCHWKSNEALDRSASADNDLDLLVGRRDAGRFLAIAQGLGFREAVPAPWKRLPGVFHLYGLDRASGRLVHIHAQVQLVVGDDMTKNYRLPIEDAYLETSEQGPLFRVPSVEAELAVFVVRMMLKHATLDAVLSGLGRLRSNEVRELVDLTRRADPAIVRSFVEDCLPFIGSSLWWRCLRTIERGTSLRSRVMAARQLQHALAAHARRSEPLDVWVRVWRRSRVLVRRLTRAKRGKDLALGGALVAVVGGDGAGKSTAVDELCSWLSEAFLVTRVHLGKPPRSLLTRIGRGLWGVGRRPEMTAGSNGSGTDQGPIGTGLSARQIWDVLNARDRYRAYARARRRATNGRIVVCDRYPLPEISLMDGGRGRRLLDAPDPKVRLLARLERRYYDHVRPPDILIVLRVDPDVAVLRKRGEERETFVRPRVEEIWRTDWSDTPAIVVDANRPKAEVLSDVRALVWERL